MIAELDDLGDQLAADGALQRAVVEKRDVLRPRQPDRDAQPCLRGCVEQIASRSGVGADRVDAELRHLAEVGGHLADLVALRVGRKRTVGDTFDEETLVPRLQELAVRREADSCRQPRFAANVRVGLDRRAHNRFDALCGQLPIVSAVNGRS